MEDEDGRIGGLYRQLQSIFAVLGVKSHKALYSAKIPLRRCFPLL